MRLHSYNFLHLEILIFCMRSDAQVHYRLGVAYHFIRYEALDLICLFWTKHLTDCIIQSGLKKSPWRLGSSYSVVENAGYRELHKSEREYKALCFRHAPFVSHTSESLAMFNFVTVWYLTFMYCYAPPWGVSVAIPLRTRPAVWDTWTPRVGLQQHELHESPASGGCGRWSSPDKVRNAVLRVLWRIRILAWPARQDPPDAPEAPAPEVLLRRDAGCRPEWSDHTPSGRTVRGRLLHVSVGTSGFRNANFLSLMKSLITFYSYLKSFLTFSSSWRRTVSFTHDIRWTYSSVFRHFILLLSFFRNK